MHLSRHHHFSLSLAIAACLAVFNSASATPIFDEFGPLDDATFGGTGIPNDEVAISSQFVNGTDIITVAMSATQRFSNPALTNDGAGTYFAGPGSNFGGAGQSAFEGALWNFNYYINLESTTGSVLADYQIDLYYDFDTGFDTPIGSLGSINITNSILASPDPNAVLIEDSQNLNFGFLASSVPGFINAPGGSFDPDALGEYNFAIQVSQSGGFGVETVAMDVQVIPEPASMMMALATGSAFCLVRRRRAG